MRKSLWLVPSLLAAACVISDEPSFGGGISDEPSGADPSADPNDERVDGEGDLGESEGANQEMGEGSNAGGGVGDPPATGEGEVSDGPPGMGEGEGEGEGPAAEGEENSDDGDGEGEGGAHGDLAEGEGAGAEGEAGMDDCGLDAASDLVGVRIEIDATPCEISLAEAAAGVAFGFRVVVDTPVAGVRPIPLDSGGCSQPDGSGLLPFARISGADQAWCICDTGLCAPGDGAAVTLAVGTHAGQVEWDGHNWSGPSDTGNPVGLPFPPGTYLLTVTARGDVEGAGGIRTPFEVRATREITLVD